MTDITNERFQWVPYPPTPTPLVQRYVGISLLLNRLCFVLLLLTIVIFVLTLSLKKKKETNINQECEILMYIKMFMNAWPYYVSG